MEAVIVTAARVRSAAEGAARLRVHLSGWLRAISIDGVAAGDWTRRPIRAVVVIWLTWATILLAAARLAERFNPAVLRCSVDPHVLWIDLYGDGPLWLLRIWDYKTYLDIARFGYPSELGGFEYAFFPLWPAVLALGDAAGSAAFTGSALAIVASAAAFIGVAVCNPSGRARRTAIALACMPGSFALLLAYPDGLALAGAVWACLLAQRGSWSLAGTVALIVSLARPNGVLLSIPLALIALSARPGRVKWVAAVLPVVGFAAVMLLFWAQSGTPFAFTRTQALWHRGRPWDLPASAFGEWNWLKHYYGVLAIVFIALSIWLWRRRETRGWALYTTAVLAMSLGSGTVTSIGRHALFAFPLVWAAADGPRIIRNVPVAALGFSLNVLWIFLLRCYYP